MICFTVVVPVVVIPQRPVALVRICPHGWGPFKLRVVPDEEEQSVIELGRYPFLFLLLLGAFLALALASLLFKLALCGGFASLGSYHHCL